MSLIIANSENTFEGAIVFNNEVKKYVYKVNKKTMYVGELDYNSMLTKWNNKIKGTTWKTLMGNIRADMVNFGVWKISSEEAAKKSSFDIINTIKKKQVTPMNKECENQVETLYHVFLKAEAKMKGRINYRFPCEVGRNRIIAIVFTKNRWSILNINGTLYFYDLDTKLYTLFIKSKHKEGKNILWPIREYEKISEVAKIA